MKILNFLNFITNKDLEEHYIVVNYDEALFLFNRGFFPLYNDKKDYYFLANEKIRKLLAERGDKTVET